MTRWKQKPIYEDISLDSSRNVKKFHAKIVAKMKTHSILNEFFFSKSCRLRDNVEKYGTASFALFELTPHCANNKIFVAVNYETK